MIGSCLQGDADDTGEGGGEQVTNTERGLKHKGSELPSHPTPQADFWGLVTHC